MGKFHYGDKVRSKENAYKIHVVEHIVVLPEGTQFINDMFYENELELFQRDYSEISRMLAKYKPASETVIQS